MARPVTRGGRATGVRGPARHGPARRQARVARAGTAPVPASTPPAGTTAGRRRPGRGGRSGRRPGASSTRRLTTEPAAKDAGTSAGAPLPPATVERRRAGSHRAGLARWRRRAAPWPGRAAAHGDVQRGSRAGRREDPDTSGAGRRRREVVGQRVQGQVGEPAGEGHRPGGTGGHVDTGGQHGGTVRALPAARTLTA